jgi:hypothetical protein
MAKGKSANPADAYSCVGGAKLVVARLMTSHRKGAEEERAEEGE